MSSPYEFFAACEGYFDKMRDEASIQRFAAYRIHQSLVEKPLSIQKFWPLEGDKPHEPTTVILPEGFWEQVRSKHKNIK